MSDVPAHQRQAWRPAWTPASPLAAIRVAARRTIAIDQAGLDRRAADDGFDRIKNHVNQLSGKAQAVPTRLTATSPAPGTCGAEGDEDAGPCSR